MSEYQDPTRGLPMFEAPPPPTGPKAEEYSRDDGRPEKFVAWIQTGEGVHFMLATIGAARRSMHTGDRFSVLGYVHSYRETRSVRINNTFAPWIADELVKRDPGLLDTIERRARKKKGPS